MTTTRALLIQQARTFLFVPATRPERVSKALASGADLVILDLEDAVAEDQKAVARDALAALLITLDGAARQRTLVRVNARDGSQFDEDLRMLAGVPGVAGIVLPKVGSADDVAAADAAAASRWVTVPLIECANGWGRVDAIAAHVAVPRLLFGHLDFQLDLGIEADEQQSELLPVRMALVAASRRAGIAPPVDGVSPDVRDEPALRRDVQRARRAGFTGKLCIHPAQVSVVHAEMMPTAREQEWARCVLAEQARMNTGVFQFEGQMVDEPVLARARRILSPGV